MSHPTIVAYYPVNSTPEDEKAAREFANAFFNAILSGKYEQPANEAAERDAERQTTRHSRVITMSAE